MRWWRKPWIRFLNRLGWRRSSEVAVALMEEWIEDAQRETVAERAFQTGKPIFAETSPSGDLVDHEGNIIVPWQEIMARVEER